MRPFEVSESDTGVGGLAARLTSEDFGELSSIFEKRLPETRENSRIEDPTPGQCPRLASLGSTGKGLTTNEASRMNNYGSKDSYRGPW